MPAVDAPDPGGIAFPELELLLAGLVDTPHCLGVEITVFDPDYDQDGAYAAEIVATLAAGLAPVAAPETPPARLLPAQSSATAAAACARSARPPRVRLPAPAPRPSRPHPASVPRRAPSARSPPSVRTP